MDHIFVILVLEKELFATPNIRCFLSLFWFEASKREGASENEKAAYLQIFCYDMRILAFSPSAAFKAHVSCPCNCGLSSKCVD